MYNLIAVVALILFSFLCPTDGANGANNEKNEEICMAQSVAATVESASQVKVIVPPNSAISKIYTSIVQFDFEEINGGGITVTQIGGEDIFLYDFHKDPEDTLRQP